VEYWPDVHSLEATRLSNQYLVLHPEPMLVDTGTPGSLPGILRAMRRVGVSPESLRRIVLTHCDIDHIGNARALQRISGAEVCACHSDVPYILGELPLPPLRRFIGAMLARGFRPPNIDRLLYDGDEVGDYTVLHVPGHTPGHIGLLRGAVLIGGDAVVGGRHPRPAPNIFTWDHAAARRSIERLANLDFDLLLPGHGTPFNDGPRRCREMLDGR
jgi:glyoxylase-like metal-dependent hydrolase (beta-lactamase superfamily II)